MLHFSFFILPLIWLLALPPLWLSLIAAPALRIDVGDWGDQAYLSGVHQPEKNPTETFRWTRDRAELVVPNLSGRYQMLRLHAHGWRPLGQPFPSVRVEVGGRPWGSFQTQRELRSYDILLPPDTTSPNIRVTFISDVYASDVDRREVGFAIDWIELRDSGLPAGPAPFQLGGQALLRGLALALVGSLAPGQPRAQMRGSRAARAVGALPVLIGTGLAALLVGANFVEPLWVAGALPAWLIVAGALLAATWLVGPRFERWMAPWLAPRQARAAWALLVAALALRLLGATHPLFDIHDLGFHTNWLASVIRGELYIYSTPSEFQNRATFNPPIGYLLMAPLQLFLPSLRLSIQVAIGLVDALGCLMVLLLARELGLGARAGLLALALYIAMPMNTTMLWWGFATNAMAQAAGLVLFWALLRLARRPRGAALAIFTTAVATCLLMHIGALVPTLALLGGAVALGWLRLAPAARRAVVGGAALALALAVPIYFTAVVDPALARPLDASDSAPLEAGLKIAHDVATKVALEERGVLIGFLPIAAALAPLGYLLLLAGPRRRRAMGDNPLRLALLLAWPAVSLAFFAVYLGVGLYVRYAYFATPLVCLALGALLAALWRRRARLVVTAIVLLVAWSGVALWVGGVLMRVKPSLVPLTH
jgi:toxin CptA